MSQRILFGFLGLASAAGGAFLILRENSPELGGTALLIVAALFLALMVIGRLPKMLEIAGVPLEFQQDEMLEFLRTLRGAADADIVLSLEEQLRNMSADPKLFKDAQKLADQEPEASAAAPASRPNVPPSGGAPAWLSMLTSRTVNATVEKEARILGGPGSGRGQPPRVDRLIRFSDQPAVILEELAAWNVSTLEVLGRRLNRVMSNHPTVEKLLVIVPEGGLNDTENWRDSLWGGDSTRKVEVLAEGSDGALAVQAWLDSLPEWKQP